MRRVVIVYTAALLAIAAVAAAGVQAWFQAGVQPLPRAPAAAEATAPPKGWSETAWPFLNDQFGMGRAFDCAARDCGAAIHVTFRAKIGFCNCATGVSDDEELERIGDVEMAGKTFAPASAGREIRVGSMAGRSRAYASGRGDAQTQILSLAFNERCDVIVATARSPDARPDAIEGKALEFLNSPLVLRWAELTLGL